MSEIKPLPPKKMVSRSVAIALGIICIVLVVGLVGAFVYYNQLTTLANSTVWVNNQTVEQGAGAYSFWTFSASYAGYVSVLVQSSTVSGTHVGVIYSAYGVNFNQEITVSAGSSAVFPLLPSSSIMVEVGNGNILSSATETVTITYYY